MVGDKIGPLAQGWKGVAHRYRAFAKRQKGKIIFCVPDANDIMRRQFQIVKRCDETGRLINSTR